MSRTMLNQELTTGPQITPQDVEQLAADGFAGIINNRPDGEAPDQPRSEELEAEARRRGLKYWHIPIVPGQATADDGKAFAAALRESDGPVFAFCRTGNRSTALARMTGITGS